MKKLILIGSLAALVAAISLAAAAVARVAGPVKSTTTISRSLPLYHGKVKSGYPQCRKHRKVKLYRKVSGPDQFLGSDKTNRKGRWKVGITPVSGYRYYAKAHRKVYSGGTGLICRPDRSKTIQYVADI